MLSANECDRGPAFQTEFHMQYSRPCLALVRTCLEEEFLQLAFVG